MRRSSLCLCLIGLLVTVNIVWMGSYINRQRRKVGKHSNVERSYGRTMNISSLAAPKSTCNYNGSAFVSINFTAPNLERLNSQMTVLRKGGHFVPKDCVARQKIAIVIPYRNRERHLNLFLQHIHPFLQTQKLEYTVYIVELEQNVIFKKGLLMNAGFLEIAKRTKVDCYIFHDVDMLPMNTGISYTCVRGRVNHPTVFVKQYNYSQHYNRYMGGVLMFEESSFRRVNGFSNLYWGWGGEDDDMYFRLKEKNISITRSKQERLRYWSGTHDRQFEFLNRKQYIERAVERMHEDGLNSAKYRVIKMEERPLYTWINVSANQTDGNFQNLTQFYVPNTKNDKHPTNVNDEKAPTKKKKQILIKEHA